MSWSQRALSTVAWSTPATSISATGASRSVAIYWALSPRIVCFSMLMWWSIYRLWNRVKASAQTVLPTKILAAGWLDARFATLPSVVLIPAVGVSSTWYLKLFHSSVGNRKSKPTHPIWVGMREWEDKNKILHHRKQDGQSLKTLPVFIIGNSPMWLLFL